MTEELTRVKATWRMHWIEGADHSFHVLKSSGRNDDAVMHEIGDVAAEWVVVVAGATVVGA
jgi:hypothetical protein